MILLFYEQQDVLQNMGFTVLVRADPRAVKAEIKGGKTKSNLIWGGKEIDKKPITILLSVGLRRDRRRLKRL